jgi:hypothetical protein
VVGKRGFQSPITHIEQEILRDTKILLSSSLNVIVLHICCGGGGDYCHCCCCYHRHHYLCCYEILLHKCRFCICCICQIQSQSFPVLVIVGVCVCACAWECALGHVRACTCDIQAHTVLGRLIMLVYTGCCKLNTCFYLMSKVCGAYIILCWYL